jgi:hypothetical protein
MNKNYKINIYILILIFITLAITLTYFVSIMKANKSNLSSSKPGSVVVRDVPLQNDFTNAKIKKSDLKQGCFAKDCIKSIENPKFETIKEADEWLEPTDRVFAVNYNGIVRAYPQRILNWHEIVNDSFGDTPVAITFCPLCGSAVAFERIVDGVTTEFGVSGKLHNSDLVMYDRYEGNLWQQITGEAIVGPAAGRDEVLKDISIITVSWEQWKTEQPTTQVLSRETGFKRNYNQYPYGTYESNDELLFGVEGLDKSLQIKTVVYGIEVDGISKAYPESIFDNQAKILDTIGTTKITLEKKPDGEIIVKTQSGESITPLRLFWFAWAAFHPDTELYKK